MSVECKVCDNTSMKILASQVRTTKVLNRCSSTGDGAPSSTVPLLSNKNHLCFNASAAEKRLETRLFRHCLMKSLASALTLLRRFWSNCHWPALMEVNSSESVLPTKGGAPESRINAITPTDHTSHLASYFPASTSGATYSLVPQGLCIFLFGTKHRLNPKSIIFSSESFFSVSKRMFSSFRSRCTTLFAWQYATAVRME
mmetsp:Transcript_48836/g.85432  ORF Transcript_48836/g.85432 Transcript_48836/m.85432 type:complete len:200 (-) Transcript_48836:447-1046(-)